MTGGNDEIKKSLVQKIFATRTQTKEMNKDSFDSSRIHCDLGIEGPVCSGLQHSMPKNYDIQSFRVFVGTWNVGGKSPHNGLNLDEFLQVDDPSDIYVLGFQEIVPLNAGNVLVIEDNGPAAKWLSLISQSLNRSPNGYGISKTISTLETKSSVLESLKPIATTGSSLFFHKISLKAVSDFYRAESKKRLKSCNCPDVLERKYSKDSCFNCQQPDVSEDEFSFQVDDGTNTVLLSDEFKYSLVASKQMVGIFLTIWVRKELVHHIGHLRTSYVRCGIMGCLGNKGCISVSMSFHKTSFCFICSHLASGEKDGDELRRNSDVIEILKNTQFSKICKTLNSGVPEKILEHDRVIWLGDLNYRIALSYSETRKYLEENNWDALLSKDQLKIEREAGRVLKRWKEGKIYFAPTYKYSSNSDNYSGESINSKNKRRTPAWCDRILWHGNGIQQLSYIRWESRFSDHRPVCAKFLVDVVVSEGGRKGELFDSSNEVGLRKR